MEVKFSGEIRKRSRIALLGLVMRQDFRSALRALGHEGSSPVDEFLAARRHSTFAAFESDVADLLNDLSPRTRAAYAKLIASARELKDREELYRLTRE